MNVWLAALVRGSKLPLAPKLPKGASDPLWTKDGSRIVFSADHAGSWDL
jgi:WD40-like Beta Propeller Repeat